LLKDSFKKTNRWSDVDENDIKALVGMDGYIMRQKLNRKDLG
jgi:hypothetical protein